MDRKLGVNPPRGLEQHFQFAKRFQVHHAGLGGPDLAASHSVQHPQWHLQNSERLDILQVAACHCQSALGERGMQPHLAIMPGMPRIAYVSEFPCMGVLLLTRITPRRTTKAS